MTRKNSHTVVSLSAIALLLTGAVLYAGPLNPPVGPVTSTNKTMTEVEPRVAISAANTAGDADSLFKISSPGSYYLVSNITGAAGKHGIEIAASGVTLDLNGFDLVGVPGMGAFDGVRTTVAGLTNIAVVNGSVRNWGQTGINLSDFNVVGCRAESIQGSGNVLIGVQMGNNAHVSKCTTSGSLYGIFAGINSTISNCAASSASEYGIYVGAGSTVNGCTSYLNAGVGILANSGSNVTGCSAFDNTRTGIQANSGSTVTSCSAYSNAADGFSIGNGTAIGCTAFSNTGRGIVATAGSTISNCTALGNTLHGIVCTSGCVISGNTCTTNGTTGAGAGIRAEGGDNRIEGNNCSGANTGIVVVSAGNLIIKNSCSGNTINFDFVANNRYGPIVNITAANPATVSGNAAASTVGSTDPWANFAY